MGGAPEAIIGTLVNPKKGRGGKHGTLSQSGLLEWGSSYLLPLVDSTFVVLPRDGCRSPNPRPGRAAAGLGRAAAGADLGKV